MSVVAASDAYVAEVKTRILSLYKELQRECPPAEYQSEGYRKVRECAELFWRYRHGTGVPLWQEGWRQEQMSVVYALRVIGEKVIPLLEAAKEEKAGIGNWYLRSKINKALEYVKEGRSAHAWGVTGQATEQAGVTEQGGRMPAMVTMRALLGRLEALG